MTEAVEEKKTISKKAVIKKNKVKVVLIGKYLFFKNKSGRLSWMPIPKSSKQIKVGDEIEI